MWVRICTLAFGTVVSGVEDFASLLGGDRGLRGLLRVDSLLGGRVSCSLSRRFSSCLGVLPMSTAATEKDIREYLTTGVDGKPGIPAGLAEPIVEYLTPYMTHLETNLQTKNLRSTVATSSRSVQSPTRAV